MGEHERKPQTHEAYIYREFLEQIRSGQKTAEVRAKADGRYDSIYVGDRIKFISAAPCVPVTVQIDRVVNYADLESLKQAAKNGDIDISKIAPGMNENQMDSAAKKAKIATGAIILWEFHVVEE